MRFLVTWEPFFQQLSTDVQLSILEFLCCKDIIVCFCVSKLFYVSLKKLSLVILQNENIFSSVFNYGKVLFVVVSMLCIHALESNQITNIQFNKGSILSKYMLDKHENNNDFYFSIGENHSFMKMNNDVHHYSRGNNFFGQNGLKQRGIFFFCAEYK